MSTDTEDAWYAAWKPHRPPATDHLVPTRRALFDAGRKVGLSQGYAEAYRVLTGRYPTASENPYAKESA